MASTLFSSRRMIVHQVWVVSLITLTMLACRASSIPPSRSGGTTSEPADDVREVERVVERIIAADNAGDLESVLALYTEDAILMPPDSPIVQGKAAIRERYRAGFEQFHMNLSMVSEETQVAGNWAFNRGVTEARPLR